VRLIGVLDIDQKKNLQHILQVESFFPMTSRILLKTVAKINLLSRDYGHRPDGYQIYLFWFCSMIQ
jgi:hypothetical protein